MSTTLPEATKDNFRDLVAEGLVLVDVWGPQCQPCVALTPHVEQIAERNPDIQVVKLEAPKARRLCMELGLMGLPIFLMYKDGEEVARLSDPNLSADRLETWVAETLRGLREEVS